jgi:hypothetical protein
MLFVRQAPCQWRTKHEEIKMLGVQVRDLLLRGLPEGALEEGRRPQNYVQEDPGAPPQNGGRRERVARECWWGRGGVENKWYRRTPYFYLTFKKKFIFSF